jgi:uncharacterized protein involved in outer membrane biogenesis
VNVAHLVNLIVILILVVCGVLIAVSARLHFVNLDPFRETIETVATRATGRNVEINGHLDVNILPNIEVILNDVSLPMRHGAPSRP